MIEILYIYCRNFENEWKVLNHEDAKELHYNLLKEGWEHSATIDPIKYIEDFLNNKL